MKPHGIGIGLGIVSGLALCALLAPILAPFPADAGGEPNLAHKLLPPSSQHPLGTDVLGRDIFSRLLFGARISLSASVAVVGLALLLGIPIGLVAGFVGGKLDHLLMRMVDGFLAFPPLLLPLAIASALGPSLLHATVAVSVTWWPWYARLIRAQVLSVKEEPFIESARAVGLGEGRILLRHILPNSLAPLIAQATLDLGYAILAIASLGFLGVGAQPPTPEWGSMILSARVYFIEYWWTVTFPGAAIFITVLGFTLVGDGLGELLDPKEA